MSPALAAKPSIVKPPVPPEILELVGKPILRGEYRGTEQKTWREGMPIFGKKVTSQRDVAFSNEFQILTEKSRPLVWEAGASLQGAVYYAMDISRSSRRPDYIGPSMPGVGVGVLQAKDGAYYAAYIGVPRERSFGDVLFTSDWEMSDRFGGQIRGDRSSATDARALNAWTPPVDKHGKAVVGVAPPPNEQAIGAVRDVSIEKLDSLTPMLKAIIDEKRVYGDQATSSVQTPVVSAVEGLPASA